MDLRSATSGIAGVGPPEFAKPSCLGFTACSEALSWSPSPSLPLLWRPPCSWPGSRNQVSHVTTEPVRQDSKVLISYALHCRVQPSSVYRSDTDTRPTVVNTSAIASSAPNKWGYSRKIVSALSWEPCKRVRWLLQGGNPENQLKAVSRSTESSPSIPSKTSHLSVSKESET